MLNDYRADKGGLLMLTGQLRGNTVLHGSSPCQSIPGQTDLRLACDL